MVTVKKIKAFNNIATVIVIDLKNTSFLDFVKIFTKEYNRLQMSNSYGLGKLMKLLNKIHQKQEYSETEKAYVLKKIVDDTDLESGYLHFWIYNMTKLGYKVTSYKIFTSADIDISWLEEELCMLMERFK